MEIQLFECLLLRDQGDSSFLFTPARAVARTYSLEKE